MIDCLVRAMDDLAAAFCPACPVRAKKRGILPRSLPPVGVQPQNGRWTGDGHEWKNP